MSDWIRKLLPRAPPMLITQVSQAGTLIEKAVPLSVQVPYVCAQCNHGWMSRLETWTAPHLTPLILGEASTITPEGARLMAMWTLKTAITCQERHPPGPIPHAFYDHLFRSRHQRKAQAPPASLRLMLVRYQGDFIYGNTKMMPLEMAGRLPDGRDAKADGYGVSITVGKVVLQIFATWGHDEDFYFDIRDFGVFAPAVVKAWPTTVDLAWPPSVAVADDMIEVLYDAWARNPWVDV